MSEGFAVSSSMKTSDEKSQGSSSNCGLDSRLHQRWDSQTIQQPCLLDCLALPFQTPPILKRKRRPSSVKAPREQPKRDILWITEPPLFPSDLDDSSCNDDNENTRSLSRPSYNPFRRINNRRTQASEEDNPNRRTPFSYIGFPNIPSLDDSNHSPESIKAITSPSLPSVPSVSIWKNRNPLKMRRMNSLGER